MSAVCVKLTCRMRVNGLLQQDVEMRVNFRYTSHDPYAVSLTFLDESRTEWLVARSLMSGGLLAACGEGDVWFIPGTDAVAMHMQSPDGSAVATFDKQELADALQSTYLVVREGAESKRLDWSDTSKFFPGVTA